MNTFFTNKNTSLIKYILLLFAVLFSSNFIVAQTKEQLRYEIDTKREGVDYTSKDALPRGREFKRIDSSYYVGWLLEGTYKYEHAADYLGFKMAAEQLQKASDLLVKDFKKQLQTRTVDVFEFIKNMKYHKDWDYMAYCLMNCYSNTDENEKLWKHLLLCKKLDLQDEMYMDTYNYLAWTVHRNRFYTKDKFSFLRKNITENEAYANKLLDSSITKIKRDAALNKKIFTVDYEGNKMPGVWHYKSILFSYQLNIESAAYYYEKLRNTIYFPANNYATFCAIQAKFAEADKYYNISKQEDSGDKRMKESFYYGSIMSAYKNDNSAAIDELKNLIKANGSTPGFGWYNIALARNLMYDGQTEIAKRYALRAEQFKEIHIGTTLGQSHYDFSVALLNLILKVKEIESIKFLHKNWWYSPTALSAIAQKTVEKYGMQFLIINQFATNPERENVVYKLFSTESTISFDEVWYLIDGFSTNFFLEKFKKEISTEKRYNVKRYYKLFVAKLLMKKGEYEEAKSYLESILNDLLIDKEYEKLFLARVYEALIICKKELKETDVNSYKQLLYENYATLIPFSSISYNVRLHSNENSNEEKEIISTIKNSNENFTSDVSANAIDFYVTFSKKNDTKMIQYYSKYNGVESKKNKISYTPLTAKAIATQLCFSIFNVENDDMATINSEKNKK